MSFFVTKTLLAVLFIAAGLTAALSMLTLMGKSERKMGVMALRNTHRAAGYTFVVLLVVLAIMGLRYFSAAADTLSLRGVLHWSAAALLVFVLALKLAVVRWFKQFIKFVPVMGMIVITLALVVATLSAVFFVATGGMGTAKPSVANVEADVDTVAEVDAVVSAEVDAVLSAETEAELSSETEAEASSGMNTQPLADANEQTSAMTAPAAVAKADPDEGADGNASAGEQIFAGGCSSCHHIDSIERKIGPGLAGLFGRETIEASGLAVTPENVRAQIVTPAGRMPSFKGFLSEQELYDLIAYLQTL